jgi:eukaryotic-like serine/threonine-protein kinase
MVNPIGQCLGRYRILEQLGEGGMAMVYKAYDPQLDREVAVKVIRRGAFPPDQLDLLLKRFEREAKVLAGLAHPNIVKVLDFGEEQGVPYLVMEYILGGSLKDVLSARNGQPVSWQEAARYLAPIARALEAAHQHEARIIHRDVKPSNILITKYGTPMLTDFGIAKVLEAEETAELTATGVGIGTPDYMAPEQATGAAVDPRVDIYALGVVFFEMITGQKPYRADTPMAVMIMKSTEPLPRPTRLVPGLPGAIDHILFKALARDPDDRYPTMGELADVLEGLSNGILPKADVPARQPSERSNRVLWWMLSGGLVLMCFLAALGVGSYRYILSVGGIFPWNIPAQPTATLEQILPPVLPTETEVSLPATAVNTSTVEPDRPTTRDNAELVQVPEGEFLMGSDADEPYFWGAEYPKHTVYLDSFWIYRTEVTNAMYRLCVEQGGCAQPVATASRTHENYYGSPEFNDYPVIHVTQQEAASYCQWASARLPTEAEWEKAARGTDGRLFPWGDEALQNNFANFCDEGCPDPDPKAIQRGMNDGYHDTAPVGSFPVGASPYGALDMAGNVLEWVSDWYGQDYYSQSPHENPPGPQSGTRHIIRGGSWWSGPDGLRPAARASRALDFSSDMVGFRCAVDGP